MRQDAEQVARGVLDQLQDAVTAKDLEALSRLFDDDDTHRDAFRLTCVAVKHEDGWRLRHFHGSVPQ